MAKASEVCEECGKKFKGVFAPYIDQRHSNYPELCGQCAGKLTPDEAKAARDYVKEQAARIKLLTVGAIPEGMEPVGIARGSTARARNAIADFGAGLKNMVGGEVVSYTQLIADAREQALQRLGIDAAKMGADMVVGVRFTSTTVDTGISEILAYGTALKKIEMETKDE